MPLLFLHRFASSMLEDWGGVELGSDAAVGLDDETLELAIGCWVVELGSDAAIGLDDETLELAVGCWVVEMGSVMESVVVFCPQQLFVQMSRKHRIIKFFSFVQD